VKIVVTGATGFLGSHLLRALHGEGHELTILKRNASSTERIGDFLQDVVSYDLDTGSLEEIFRSKGTYDAIIHTATCYGRGREPASAIQAVNVDFPLRLLEAGAMAGVDTFFNADTSLPADMSFYALSKHHFKEWGKIFAGKRMIRFVNVKLEYFYGVGDDGTKFVSSVIRGCLNNLPELALTAGEQQRDFIHVDDVSSVYLLLLRKAAEIDANFQEYQVGSGEPVRVRDLVEMIHDFSSSKTVLNFGAVPYRKNEVMVSRADISALADLGWSCGMSLSDGIRKTIEQERDQMFPYKENNQ